MNTKSLQQEVTNEIIESLEEGVAPWHCPWVLPKSQISLPYNISTGKIYSGINILMLWVQMMHQRYTTNGWITFKQAHKMHGHVIKGEKATRCFYYDLLEIKDEDDEEAKLVPYVKCFSVFNLDQVSGGNFALPNTPKFDINEKAEQLIKATGAAIEEGRKAYYNISEDLIVLPSKGVFGCSEEYYATLFHELVHWTQHEGRLNRIIKAQKFGDEAYAFEELVAELGSAFLCAELGLVNNYQNHVSYIDGWLKILKTDSTAIFKAASLASKAHRYIMPNTIEEEMLPVNSGTPNSQTCNETLADFSKVGVV
jgi:antirestriction protein ArdC